MAIRYPPDIGLLLLCDFDGIVPEMRKKRPVVVLASVSPSLCIVIPLSITDPDKPKPWHCIVTTPDPLPPPYDAKDHWAKCDMLCPVCFRRLAFPCKGKDKDGNRLYAKIKLNSRQMRDIRRCVAAAMGINKLDFASC